MTSGDTTRQGPDATGPRVAPWTGMPRLRPWMGVLRLSIPAVGENVAWSLGQTLLFVIAGLIGPEAIAGFGATESVRWFLATGVRAMSAGLVAVVSRRVGAGRYLAARAFTLQALTVTVGLMIVVGTLASLNSRAILTAVGLTPRVVDLAAPHARLAFLSTIPQAVYVTLGSVLKASGDTRTPMVGMSLRSAVMVALGYVLIDGKGGGPRLGLAAMGLGMLLGWSSALFPLVATLRRSAIPLTLSWRRGLRPRWVLTARLIGVGLPAGVEELSLATGQLVFTRILTSLGTAVFAAHLIGFNISGYGLNMAFGFAIAASTLVGQHLGARDPAGARIHALWAAGVGVAVITLFGGTLVLASGSLAGLFTHDGAVVETFRRAAPVVGLSLPGLGIFSILAGGLRGAGDTKGPMYATLVGLWTIRLGTAYLLGIGLGWGLTGVWLGWAADQWVRAIWIGRRFLRGRWQTLRI